VALDEAVEGVKLNLGNVTSDAWRQSGTVAVEVAEGESNEKYLSLNGSGPGFIYFAYLTSSLFPPEPKKNFIKDDPSSEWLGINPHMIHIKYDDQKGDQSRV
jgi:hypothetical protein